MKFLLPFVIITCVASIQKVCCQNKTIDSLKVLLPTQKEDTNKVNILNEVSKALTQNHNYTNAIAYANEALSLSAEINFNKGKAATYENIGWIYSLVDNYSEALKHAYKALKLYEDFQDKQGIAQVSFSVGDYYFFQENHSEPLKYYFASLKLYEEIGNKTKMALCNYSIAEFYFQQGNYSEALKKNYTALKIFQELGEQWPVSDAYTIIGNIYKAQGEMAYNAGDIATSKTKYNDALKKYKASLKISEELDYKECIADSYTDLGSININLKNFSQAGKYLEKSLKMSKKIESKYLIKNSYYIFAKLDSATRNYKQAYEHYKMYILYRDSMVNEESIRKSEGYKMQYEFDKKEDQIKLLSTENKLQTALAHQENQRKNLAYAGIGVILLAGSYGFYRFRKRKRLQNQQALMNERLRISRELHDEVGATLSGIAMYSHLTKEQIKQSNTIEVEKSLNIMQQSAGEMVNKLNDIVWLVNPDQDSLQKLIQRLEEYARDMAAIKNMQVKVNVPEHLS